MKRLLGWIRNHRFLTALTLAGILLVVYTLAGFFLLPFLVTHYAPRLAAEQLKRQVSVAEVSFNPFLFTLEVKDFSLREESGEPLGDFQRLFVDFELASLFQPAWTFADFLLEQPSVNLVVDREGRLNLAKIADDLPKSEEPPSSDDETAPAVLLKHFVLADGSVHYSDRSKREPVDETISPISLELRGISTLPDAQGSHHLAATFGSGGTFAWQGKVALNPMFSEGDLDLEGFKLLLPWGFVRDQLNLAEPGGELGIKAHYRFQKQQDTTDLKVSGIAATVAGLRLTAPEAAEPMLALDRIELADGSFDLETQTVRIPKFLIQKGRVLAVVDENGEMNWQHLARAQPPASGSAAGSPSATPSRAPWQVKVDAFAVDQIGVSYIDASRKAPLQVTVGTFGLKLGAGIEIGADRPKVLIENLAVDLDDIALNEPGKTKSLVNLDGCSVEGGRFDLEKQELMLGQIRLEGGGAAVTREADGRIHLLEVFAPEEKSAKDSTGESASADVKSEGNPWRFGLQQLALEDFQLALADRSASPEIAYDLEDLDIALNGLSNDGKTPIGFEGQLKLKQGGGLNFSGTASQTGDEANARLQIDRINLQPLQSVIAQMGALKLEGADLSTKLQLNYRRGKSGPAMTAVGGATLGGLLLREAKSGKRFLSWKTLMVDGIDFALEPNKLAIKEVRIVEPGANIEIFKDQSTNIAAIFQNPKGSKPSVRKEPAKATKPSESTTKPFPVTIARVRIDDGIVDFSDQALVLPFATRIHQFDGTVTGISTAPSSQTLLKFDGRVDRYGEVKVDGALRPLQHKVFSDIKVIFRNVEMNSLSPYSGTFAGRRIQSGKMNLDLEYKTDNGKLKSNNTIVLEQLALGKQIESPKATSLPLDLAIALLTDSEGKINASIPVEGDIDNPEFAYGKVIWDAVVTLITKAVAAPFNAIAGLFDGGAEEISAIRFESGQDAIPPPELEKLKKVATALSKRPSLILEVRGGFDPKLDGNALKSLQVRRSVADKLDFALQPGEDPGPVAFDSAGAQRALEDLAKERGGPATADTVQSMFEKSRGRKADRIGRMASLVGRASQDSEFYQALFEHLVETTPLSPKELEGLAERRGRAVVSELAKQPGIGAGRVKAGKVQAVEGDAERVSTHLNLGVEGS